MKFFGLTILFCCIFYLEALKFNNPKSDILPTKEVCGHQTDGVNSEFPWVVFIPLQTRTENPDANVRCAGALISKRYVLINKSSLQFVLTKVHIGQYDTSKDEICNGPKCAPVQKIDVEGKVVDDNLDVVLLRLAKDVEFTDNVRPICLPFEELKRAETGETVYTSGWGGNNLEERFSLTKKKVKETLISKDDCQKAAKNDKSICVQATEDSKAKPCNGDEGSPIMYSSNGQWVLEGILGYVFESEAKTCSINEPARGSRITEEVLQWIINNIKA